MNILKWIYIYLDIWLSFYLLYIDYNQSQQLVWPIAPIGTLLLRNYILVKCIRRLLELFHDSWSVKGYTNAWKLAKFFVNDVIFIGLCVRVWECVWVGVCVCDVVEINIVYNYCNIHWTVCVWVCESVFECVCVWVGVT